MERTRKISDQVKAHANKKPEKQKKYDGDEKQIISTGSTLLDLSISGGRVRGGGIPAGILVEIFGPEGCGKTIMLSEIAGNVQRPGGQVRFRDPEGRLDKQFSRLFGLNPDIMDYERPDTVLEALSPIRKWNPEPEEMVHGIFIDSLAALTTDMEMEEKDKMGMRRAKEFSEQLRLTCRIIKQKNFLVVCSNQIRQKIDAQEFEYKYTTPGGKAIPYYSSLRIRCSAPREIKRKKTIAKKEVSKTIGVQTDIKIVKSTVWKPYRTATLYILFDYGIDDIRANLQFIKDMTGAKTYQVEDENYQSLLEACRAVEEYGYEKNIRENVIDLWEEIEEKFKEERKPKQWR